MSEARPAPRSEGSAPLRRCAIYTRKSTDEGLERDFNSLEAQREACEAYVLSQRHEGWALLAERYDDGGFSGASMERPGLEALLADVAAGRIDVVVVYKVDRLTRALSDFARMVAIFDEAGTSFVSVTQAFNTTTSMGRLTLNVLLSFAQFEREVTAERIRDKIAASKKKGMWMGGTVPLGYRTEDRRLMPAPGEARLVRHIFERYLALGSVRQLKAELARTDVWAPVRNARHAEQADGAAFSRGKLYAMLANPIYVGRIRHGQESYPGRHTPIVEPELWQAVQDRLAGNRRDRRLRRAARCPSPLAGRLFDPDGRKMRPSHARKGERRYRYYVSGDLVEGTVATGAKGWRIPAAEIEGALARTIAGTLRAPDVISGLIADGYGAGKNAERSIAWLGEIAKELEGGPTRPSQDLLRALVHRVALSETELSTEVSFAGLAEAAAERLGENALASAPALTVAAPIALRRRGAELRLVLEGAAAAPPLPDPMLIRTITEARARLSDYLDPDASLTVSDLARREGADLSDVSRSLHLAFLAPDILERILDGRQPPTLTATRLSRLTDLPLLWEEQRAMLG